MRFFLFVVGGVLALIGVGVLASNAFGDGPGGAASAVEDGAHVLDALLYFAAAAGAITWGAVWKRERQEKAKWASRTLPDLPSEDTAAPRQTAVTAPVVQQLASSPVAGTSRITVYGYSETFAVNPKVKILWNGAEVGTVGRDERTTVSISSGGEMVFKYQMRSARLSIRAGQDAAVKLSWSRATGKLSAMRVDPTKLNR